MEQLVEIKKDEAFTNSKIIAEGTGNKHHAIQQLITKYENDISYFGALAFEMRVLKHDNYKGSTQEKVYLLTEEQATFVISLMRNNKIVVAFKKELVRQFYAMRQFIFERQTKSWVHTREQGKITRKAETDTLKELAQYAKEQGSEHPNKLYISYTKLANKICGISGRDNATIEQLSSLTVAENIILHCIQAGIQDGKHYKEIYQDCKKRLEMFRDIAFLEVA